MIPTISKIIVFSQKFLFGRLLNSFRKFYIINKSQHGYVEGKSTYMAIYLLEDFIKAFEDNCISPDIFIDFSKAFISCFTVFYLESLKLLSHRYKYFQPNDRTQYVKHIRFLWILKEQHLNWQTFSENVIGRLKSVVYALRVLKTKGSKPNLMAV